MLYLNSNTNIHVFDNAYNLTLTSVVFEYVFPGGVLDVKNNLTLTSVVFESHAISKTMAVMII